MPIYEYACPDCGHQFEALQKFSDDPIRECPTCKALNVKKRISATSFVLKGSGWYKDHYGLKSGASESSGGASTSSGTASTPAATAAPAASGATSTGTSGGSGGTPTPSAPAAPAK